jgi:hypothetical protein
VQSEASASTPIEGLRERIGPIDEGTWGRVRSALQQGGERGPHARHGARGRTQRRARLLLRLRRARARRHAARQCRRSMRSRVAPAAPARASRARSRGRDRQLARAEHGRRRQRVLQYVSRSRRLVPPRAARDPLRRRVRAAALACHAAVLLARPVAGATPRPVRRRVGAHRRS